MSVGILLLFVGLTILSCLSPLLTFASLWQLKEWRIDRLKEHLRMSGYWNQLFGTTRPPLIAILLVFSGFLTPPAGQLACLFVLAAMSIVQIGLKKQPMPVWTRKAQMILLLSVGLVGLFSWGLILWTTVYAPGYEEAAETAMLVLPLIASFFIGLSWLLLRPLDIALKNRVLKRAQRLREAHPNLRVIGITGSVGKTTVKELLSHLLKDRGALTTPEHVNTEMGVAAWLIKNLSKEPKDSDRIFIVEMGAYRKGEIALLCRIAQPTFGVITYVGDQHLSLFGSREAIIEGKGELFASLPPNGKAFGNSDNKAFQKLKAMSRAPITAVGTGQHAEIQATDIEETAQGLTFRALGTMFKVPLSGTHNVTGVLLAAGVAQMLGVTPQDSAKKLQSFVRLSKTFEVKTIGAATVLDDTYNSSPDSVRAAIEWAATQSHPKKVLLLEGIIELGSAEAEIHRAIAEKASKIFSEIYIGDPHFLPYFADVPHVQSAAERNRPIEDGTLLAIVGRVPQHFQQRFLPR